MKKKTKYTYFLELPNLGGPSPQVINSKNTCLGIVPIFTDFFYDTNEDKAKEKLHAYAKAAIYSRETFLQNTDAVEVGVEIKLYIEDVCKDIISNILEENYITEKDIIWFNAPPIDTEKGLWGRLGKQMCHYWDKRFSEYEWLVVWDSDFFIGGAKSYGFFKRLVELEKKVHYFSEGNFARDGWHPCAYLKENLRSRIAPGLTVEEVFNLIGASDIVEEKVGSLRSVAGFLSAFPAKYYYKNRCEMLEWYEFAGPLIGSDQRTYTVWNHLSGEQFLGLQPRIGFVGYTKAAKYPDRNYTFHGNINKMTDVMIFRDLFKIHNIER